MWPAGFQNLRPLVPVMLHGLRAFVTKIRRLPGWVQANHLSDFKAEGFLLLAQRGRREVAELRVTPGQQPAGDVDFRPTAEGTQLCHNSNELGGGGPAPGEMAGDWLLAVWDPDLQNSLMTCEWSFEPYVVVQL